MRVYHTVALLLSLSFRSYFNYPRKDSREIRTGARGWIDQSLIHPFLPPPPPINRLDIYMAIAGAATPPVGVCAPRPELKPPHYHRSGPWRAAREVGRLEGADALPAGWGGCRRIRFANIGGNVASGFIQHPSRPFQNSVLPFRLLSPSAPSVLQPPRYLYSPPYYGGFWWKMEITPVGLPADIVFI